MAPRAKRFRSGVWLAIFTVATAAVFSFILFEVLDIDGSDFPGQPAAQVTPATLSEAEHDLRRAHLHGSIKLWVDATLVLPHGSLESVRLHRPPVPRVLLIRSPQTQGYRITLPRSSLPDAPRSAPLFGS